MDGGKEGKSLPSLGGGGEKQESKREGGPDLELNRPGKVEKLKGDVDDG